MANRSALPGLTCVTPCNAKLNIIPKQHLLHKKRKTTERKHLTKKQI